MVKSTTITAGTAITKYAILSLVVLLSVMLTYYYIGNGQKTCNSRTTVINAYGPGPGPGPNGGGKLRAKGPLDYYKSSILEVPKEEEKFTMILMTYKRVKTLPALLLHYCETKFLSKIIVIWNDIGSEIPQNILDVNKTCRVRVVFIKETNNSMNNRFKPRKEIETQCKLL